MTTSRRLAILIYHRVLDDVDPLRPYEVTRAQFDSQLKMLTRLFRVLPLSEGLKRLREGSLPARALALTFDDGYQDNLLNAVPVLRKYGVTATVFVATGFTDGGNMFNDLIIEGVRNCKTPKVRVPGMDEGIHLGDTLAQRASCVGAVLEAAKYLPYEERQQFAESFAANNDVDVATSSMMSSEQLRELRGSGVEVGAHTVRHPILPRLDDNAAEREIVNSKAALEQILEEPVTGFAYPNGKAVRDYGDRDVDLVQRAGFDFALTTDWAAAERNHDPFRLPRISIGTRTGLRPAATIGKSLLTG